MINSKIKIDKLSDDLLSEDGRTIFYKRINGVERLFCKYFVLSSIDGSTALLGVGSAVVVNNVTSAFGISFNSLRSFIIYVLCVIFSVLAFISIIRLYHFSSTCINSVSKDFDFPSVRVTKQLEYYEKYQNEIKPHIYRFIFFCLLFVLFGIAFCIYNRFGK